MKREIPDDPRLYSKLTQQVSLRLQASADWYAGKRAEHEECWSAWYKYPTRPETIDDSDEYETKLGYGFGMMETILAKITEPLLNMGLPFGVFPRKEGHQKKADNFADINRDFYAKPHVQMGKRDSKKEMGICGTRIEIDEWLHVVEPGKKWGMVPELVEQPVQDPATGQPIMGEDGKPLVAKAMMPVLGEVDTKITTHYGFNTRYPRLRDIYPEPDRTTIDTGQKTDISWYVEDMGELALEDLAREMIYDPAAKQLVPRYDFSKLLKDAGPRAEERYAKIKEGHGAADDVQGQLITPNHDWTNATASGSSNESTRPKSKDTVSKESFEDRDKIWVCQMRTKNEIRTVAQGKYIIERIIDPWHRPRIGMRKEVYTSDPRSFYGIGALKPVLNDLAELNITHSLGMQNLFRLVNKMIAVKEKALSRGLADLDPRAGGVVAINDEVSSAGEAIAVIQQPSAVSEMLAAESNTKGNIEQVSSQLDGSPGVMGTKQNHKTKGGLAIVEANLQTRFATNQSYALINETLSAQSMLYMFCQFCWEPIEVRSLQEDGSTTFARFTRDDIDPGDTGFDFIVSVDPTWGNTTAQRQDAQDMLENVMNYEKMRVEMKDPSMKKAVVSKFFERYLKTHGMRDLSELFINPSGEVDPEIEFQILLQGGTPKPCSGDLRHHIETHHLQKQSPNLEQAMQSGKAPPDTGKNLDLMIQQATAQLVSFLKNPKASANEKLNQVGGFHPGP